MLQESSLPKGQPIESTLTKLDKIIASCEKSKNRNGYFAAFYKTISIRVRGAIEKGEFEDNQRMTEFVEIFANYYLDAYESYHNNTLGADSPWFYAFENGKKKHTIIQHLLLGVNAHVNYDLPNTCVAVAPGKEVINLSKDYFQINQILSDAIVQLEKDIFFLSPVLGLLARIIPKLERKLLNFSVSVARSKSWECACILAMSDEKGKAEVRESNKAMTREICNRIMNPGLLPSIVMFFIMITEVRGMKKNIEVLDV
ncbi:MAG: hypothetical protein J7604_20640 [Sporocytophaga sp.]|uniref:DUF5995 family protein n=1 Tax=Sporocytophaga sp. TaxID=2231183 RepID=UPI001B1CB45C|nr:DUF5995 family protein [Sporocytophaga sp.]MBO9702632.1 hypothetical protein [Sporocytophaga sp.]